jgi:hypothetical protein
MGKTLGICPDNYQSYLYNGAGSAISATVGPVGGNGLSNNSIFPITSSGVAGVPNMNQQSAFGAYDQSGLVYNSALQERSARMANNARASVNGFIGANSNYLFNSSNLNNEFLP